MYKIIVVVGIFLIVYGISFGVMEMLGFGYKTGFYGGAMLWTVGVIAMIFGHERVSKKWYFSFR